MQIDHIRMLCETRKIRWSVHASARIQECGIERIDVLNCLMYGEIIEDYPDDFPYPSCLVYGYTMNNRIIHTVVGCDDKYLYVITAYFPNTSKFEKDLKTRKEK